MLQNVLLDASWDLAKVADCGLARMLDTGTGLSNEHGCTFAYAAPVSSAARCCIATAHVEQHLHAMDWVIAGGAFESESHSVS